LKSIATVVVTLFVIKNLYGIQSSLKSATDAVEETQKASESDPEPAKREIGRVVRRRSFHSKLYRWGTASVARRIFSLSANAAREDLSQTL
jgi:hypothetical protein